MTFNFFKPEDKQKVMDQAKRFWNKSRSEWKKALEVVKEERAKRQREKAYQEEYEAEFRYSDGEMDFVMLISADEAKVYEKAKKQLKEVERVQSDSRVLKQWEAKKYLSLHHYFSEKIEEFYQGRNEDPLALHRTIRYCERQVEYAPVAAKAFQMDPYQYRLPEHLGYETLISLYEEAEEWEQAIRLCKRARKQGWKGEWEARIYQLEEKLRKR